MENDLATNMMASEANVVSERREISIDRRFVRVCFARFESAVFGCRD